MGSTAREPEPRGERRFHLPTSLQLESVRRRTFANWPVAHMAPDDLARDGFFYTGEKDHVECVFCGHRLGDWTPGDRVRTDHAKYSPRCSFVSGHLTGNVPRASPPETDGAGRVFAFLDDYHAFRLACARPPTPGRYQSDALPLPSTDQPAFPLLSRRETRLQTFTRWPVGVGVAGDSLAHAGFFYTGVGDWVQCFQCGGGIHTWRSGDDPWADHAHFYPHCPFVREHLGEGGGRAYGMGDSLALSPPSAPSAPSASSLPTRSKELSPEEAELLLSHPFAQRLTSQGFHHELVKEALKEKVERSGLMCSNINEALEVVHDYEDTKNDSSAGK